MSRAFTGSANGSFLSADQAVVLAPPFSVVAWFQTSNAARAGTFFYLGDRNSPNDWYAISQNADGTVRAEARSAAAWPLATTSNTVQAKTADAANPQCVAAVFASSTSRKCVLNGNHEAAGTNSVACAPAAPNRTAVGALRDASPTAGFLGDIGFVAVWKRALSDSEITLLSKGTHPQDFPTDLVEVWPIGGADNPEVGLMGSGLKLAVTGAATGTFDPPVSDPAPAAGGTPVSKVWTSGLLGKRYAATRESFMEWDVQTIPDLPGGRLYAMVSLQPFADATALTAVKFAGTALTRISPDIYDGPEKAANITAWVCDLADLASNSGVPRAECDKTLWSGSIQLWATSADGAAYEFTSSASEGDGSFVELEVDTEPGALCLFMSSMQVRDGAPVGLVWEGAVLEGFEATSNASVTTDLATIAASKVVVSGESEKARANFAVSDGRAGLLLSIPPAAPSAPAATDIRAWLSSGDTAYSASLTGQVARVQLIAAEFDRDAQEIRVSLDGGPPVVSAWSGAANPAEGPLVIGAGLLDGVVQPGGNLRMLGMLASTALLTAPEKQTAQAWMAQCFAPVTRPITVSALTGAAATIDLSSGVQDPSSWGWQITALEIDTIFPASIADEHRITLDLSNVSAGTIQLRAQVASKHPLAPSSAIQVTVQAGSLSLPNRTASVAQDQSILIDVLGGTTDPAGKPLVLQAVSDPDHGTAVIESGQVRYTPDAGYVGFDDFIVTARSLGGGSVSASVEITVEAVSVPVAPVAAFSATPLTGAPPLTVQYTDESIGQITSRLWDFGGGATSTEQNPSFTYQNPGLKPTSLTVTGPGGTHTLTKPGFITVTQAGGSTGGTLGGELFGLPIIGLAEFLDTDIGKSWKDDEALIKSRFRTASGVPGMLYGVDDWQPRNRDDLDIQRPLSGQPAALRVKYPERVDPYLYGGGCALVWLVGHTGAATESTGYKRAAVSWEVWVPGNFDNVNAGTGRPFKMMGLGGGLLGAAPSGTPWTDAQSTNIDRPGWAQRWQGTGRWGDNDCQIKPYLSLVDPVYAEVINGVPAKDGQGLRWGRWMPDWTKVRLTKNAWNTLAIVFKGNSAGKKDGEISYHINGTKVFGANDVLFRPYAGFAHNIFLNTFFGGDPKNNPVAGSPQTQYLFFRNFTFAGARS